MNLSGLDFGSLGGKQNMYAGRLWRFGSVGSCLLGQWIILRPLHLWLQLMYVIEPLAALHRKLTDTMLEDCALTGNILENNAKRRCRGDAGQVLQRIRRGSVLEEGIRRAWGEVWVKACPELPPMGIFIREGTEVTLSLL